MVGCHWFLESTLTTFEQPGGMLLGGAVAEEVDRMIYSVCAILDDISSKGDFAANLNEGSV